MQKDYPVLECIFEDTGIINEITDICDAKRAPLDTIVVGKDGNPQGIDIEKLNRWWQKRCIPEKRDGSKEVFDFLKLKARTQLQLLNNGLSLSDTYWIKSPSSSVKWKDVNFFTNDFSYDVGNLTFGYNQKSLTEFNPYSPDISTNGWLKKTWVIKNNKRYLIKAGSAPEYQEPINEILATKMLEALNFVPYVKYRIGQIKDKPCSTCKNFLDENTEYVPAYLIYKSAPRLETTSVYGHLIERCKVYNIPGAEEFIDKMLQVDYIMSNADRHLGNFGFLRDVDTLKIIGPAPLFDNGTSLWNQVATDKLMTALNISKPFAKLHQEQIKFINNFYITPEFLADIPDMFEEILNAKTKMTSDRIRKIRSHLKENIDSYEAYLQAIPPEKIKGLTVAKNPVKDVDRNKIAIKESLNSKDNLDKLLQDAKNMVRAKNMLKEKNHNPEEGLMNKGKDKSERSFD